MSDSKKKCLECPICHGIFESEELAVHVNLHFDDESVVECDYPGCSAKINESQFGDHLLAHQMNASYEKNSVDILNDSALARIVEKEGQNEALNKNEALNDSILAKIIQDEENCPGPSKKSNDADKLLAMRLQEEDNKNLEEESFKHLQETHGMSDKKEGFVKQFEKQMDHKVGKKLSVSDYYEMKSNVHSSMISGYDSSNTRTQNFVSYLRTKGTSLGTSQQLLSIDTDHFSVDVGDKGWGCGYRNIQMLLSSLLKDELYRKHLSSFEDVPSVPKLQMLIETAWKAGFDIDGCHQLGGSLQGSRKWIGTTEAAALFHG